MFHRQTDRHGILHEVFEVAWQQAKQSDSRWKDQMSEKQIPER